MPKLIIGKDGTARMVYSDKWAPIARALGALEITRATDITWDYAAQEFIATDRQTGAIIARGTNRADVIAQEVKFLERRLEIERNAKS